MAATAWAFFNSFRENMGGATAWDLAGTSDGFQMSLHTSAASTNANDQTLSTYASIGSEVANGNGYATGGVSVTSRTWASVATDNIVSILQRSYGLLREERSQMLNTRLFINQVERWCVCQS